jgi:AcrR family transcriptional regulator
MKTRNKTKRTKHARLSPQERRRLIVEESLRFFSENGFDANTRILAGRLGVTQPLLFRYFPTKDDLLNAVFDLAYSRLAKRDWKSFLNKQDSDIRTKLVNFSYAYATSNYDFDWIRLYMFAGLSGGELNRRLIKRVTEPLLRQIAEMIRSELGIKTTAAKPVTREEIEYLWIFHGGLYYHAIRHRIYGLPPDSQEGLATLVGAAVDAMIFGYKPLLEKSSRKANGKRSAA